MRSGQAVELLPQHGRSGASATSAVPAGCMPPTREKQLADHGTDNAGGVHADAGAATSVDQSVLATFCFVDIAGYTALTDSHGERAAADLVDNFNRLVHAAVDRLGTVQELSGDNAFLVFPDPVLALQALAQLYSAIADQQELPLVRAGLHHGPALLRAHRYFGSTVNLAARTAAQAVGGEILCTRAVVDALALHDWARTATFEHRGPVALKNLPEPIDLYAISMANLARRYEIDPVCQMQVEAQRDGNTIFLEGRQWWFCSSACAQRFEKTPDAFLPNRRRE